MTSRPAQRQARLEVAIAVALPLAMLGAALALVTIENSLVHVGPFDSAVWGWLTMSLAWLAPVVAGAWWWARLDQTAERLARWLTFTLITLGVALPLFALLDRIGCDPAAWYEVLPRALAVGALFAGGLTWSASLSARTTRAIEGWWTRGLALLGCSVISAAALFLAAVLLVWSFGAGVNCAAPPVPAP